MGLLLIVTRPTVLLSLGLDQVGLEWDGVGVGWVSLVDMFFFEAGSVVRVFVRLVFLVVFCFVRLACLLSKHRRSPTTIKVSSWHPRVSTARIVKVRYKTKNLRIVTPEIPAPFCPHPLPSHHALPNLKRPPRGAHSPSPPRQRGGPSSSTKGGQRPKHKRPPSSSSPSSSKDEGKTGTPSHRRGGSGGSGDSGGRGGPARSTSSETGPLSPSGRGWGREGEGGDTSPTPGSTVHGIPPPHPVVEATPKRVARSLMFTSAARKRGSGYGSSVGGSSFGGGSSVGGSVSGSGVFEDDGAAATPTSSLGAATAYSSRGRGGVPPSPSGSVFSDISGAEGVFAGAYGGGGGAANSRRRGPLSSRGSGPLTLTLPAMLESEDGGGSGVPREDPPRSPLSRLAAANLAEEAQRTAKGTSFMGTALTGNAASAAAVAGAGEGAATGGVAAGAVAKGAAATNAPGAVVSSSRSDAWLLAAAVVAAVERSEPAEARGRVRPAAATAVNLAGALEALQPEQVGKSGRADDVIDKAGLASSVVREVGVLTLEEGHGGGGAGGGGAGGTTEGQVDEEAVEAAGAILSEAGLAVDSLAQVSSGRLLLCFAPRV